jgi:hypothetical protein
MTVRAFGRKLYGTPKRIRMQACSLVVHVTRKDGVHIWKACTPLWHTHAYIPKKIYYTGLLKKRSRHFQKLILQVLLNIWRCAKNRLKGELSKLFSHLISTWCEPHVWRGRCQIDNPALPTLVAACHRWQQPQPQWCAASDHRYQNFERFPFHPYTGRGFNFSSFCKINFWKCILLF